MFEGTIHHGQDRLLLDRTHRDHVILAGVGYGKTYAGPPWHYKRVIDNYLSKRSIIVAPTFSLLEQECFEAFWEFLTKGGLKEGPRGNFQINRQKMYIDIRFSNREKPIRHRILGKSGDVPKNIVATTASHAWLDEAAMMVEQVRKNILKRIRCKKAFYSQILYTTTPYGVNWFADRFGPQKVDRVYGTPFSESKSALVLHGSSHDNPYAPQHFLDMLEEEFAWDPDYYATFVLGEFRSLTKDQFYNKFREGEHVGHYPADPEIRTLYLTFDNNVGHMAWAAMQPRNGQYWVVKANDSDGRNIDACCEQFESAFPPHIWGGHDIVILGDAALHARSVHSHSTGYALIVGNLRQKYRNVTLRAHRSNPLVEERSRCTNGHFAKNRLRIDRGCRKVIASAKLAQTDPVRGIKKPKDDLVTHAMEAVDMALMVLAPPSKLLTRQAA